MLKLGNPVVLFPGDTSTPYLPGLGFEEECAAAKEAGFEVSFVGPELSWGEEPRIRKFPEDKESREVVYRGWILKHEDYVRLDATLAAVGGYGLVSPEAYRYAYHFPEWYEDLKGFTPKSASYPTDQAPTPAQLEEVFGRSGVGLILKDYVKSRKHEWWDACFIPEIGDTKNLLRVSENFLRRQGESLVGGLVFREFVKFKQIGVHSKSKLPLINEHRLFVLDGKVFYQAPYWSEGDYSGALPPKDILDPVIGRLKAGSPFLSVDVAEKEDGSWMIVEIGDGGTSGVPEGGSFSGFYEAFKKAMSA